MTPLPELPPDACTAILLVGGRSSRMGRPKALLEFQGRPLAAHLVERLRKRFGEVLLVAAADQTLPDLGAPVVRDAFPGEGPFGGIITGLREVRRTFAFVGSCDTPFLHAGLAETIVRVCAMGADLCFPLWEGRPQPLQAAYRRSVLPTMDALFAEGERRPRMLMDHVRFATLREDEARRLGAERSFFNMNTPDDYELALSLWADASGKGLA